MTENDPEKAKAVETALALLAKAGVHLTREQIWHAARQNPSQPAPVSPPYRQIWDAVEPSAQAVLDRIHQLIQIDGRPALTNGSGLIIDETFSLQKSWWVGPDPNRFIQATITLTGTNNATASGFGIALDVTDSNGLRLAHCASDTQTGPTHDTATLQLYLDGLADPKGAIYPAPIIQQALQHDWARMTEPERILARWPIGSGTDFEIMSAYGAMLEDMQLVVRFDRASEPDPDRNILLSEIIQEHRILALPFEQALCERGHSFAMGKSLLQEVWRMKESQLPSQHEDDAPAYGDKPVV